MQTHMLRSLLVVLSLTAIAGRVPAAAPEARVENLKTVDAALAAARREHAGDDGVLVRRGLVADRKAKRVTLLAEATGLAAGETIEFFLVAETSSHDYEALAVSFAGPGDVRAGLEHIGMTPGLPVDPAMLRFWPRGERVIMRFARRGAAAPAEDGVRAEQLLINRETGRPLRESGFVFTGSFIPPAGPDGMQPQGYAADVADPRSIASNYNEPQTMLDVPRQAPQGTVYGKQLVNAPHVFRAGELLEVTLEPEYADGRKRVIDLALQAAPAAESAGRGVEGLVFSLRAAETGAMVPIEAGTIEHVLQRFSALQDEGRDPYVTLRIDNATPLHAVTALCRLLSSIETETGIRMDPPPEGQLYYKAFLPEASYREREKRPSQPWELHLEPGPAGATGTVWKIEQEWKDESIYPDLKIATYPVQTPAQWQDVLREQGPGIPVVLIYAQPDLPHGALMQYLNPVRKDYPVLFVLVEPGP